MNTEAHEKLIDDVKEVADEIITMANKLFLEKSGMSVVLGTIAALVSTARAANCPRDFILREVDSLYKQMEEN